jgi:hypothetical protein
VNSCQAFADWRVAEVIPRTLLFRLRRCAHRFPLCWNCA